MPAGSGSHPSSASSGAVEAECQHEAEADDFDGYADEDPFMPVGSGSRPSSASSGAVEAESLVAVMSLMPDWPAEPGNC